MQNRVGIRTVARVPERLVRHVVAGDATVAEIVQRPARVLNLLLREKKCPTDPLLSGHALSQGFQMRSCSPRIRELDKLAPATVVGRLVVARLICHG
jgi:hypothetical protein